MKNKKLFSISFLSIVFVSVFIIGLLFNPTLSSVYEGESMYNSMVKIETTGDFDGRQTPIGEWELVSYKPNQLYDSGKEEIEDYLMEGTGASDAFDWIELGDAALAVGAPSAGKAEAYTAHAADGLSAAAGTQGSNAPSGNFTVYYEFTSTGDDQLTNISRLQNANGDDLAGNTFTLVTLQTGDKINVTWDIWVV